MKRRAPAISQTNRSWSDGVVGYACRKIYLLGRGSVLVLSRLWSSRGSRYSGKGEPDPPSRSRDGRNGPDSATRRSAFGTVAVLPRCFETVENKPKSLFSKVLMHASKPAYFVQITGPSGSGKTTLLHLLAGLDLPSEGEILVRDVPLSELERTARAEFRRKHIALVAQESMLVPFLSAYENVKTSLAIRGDNGQDEGAAEALIAVGFQSDGAASLASVRRRADARGSRTGLSAGPALLLADEPTARLDRSNAIELVRLLLELARKTGTAVVCATPTRLSSSTPTLSCL